MPSPQLNMTEQNKSVVTELDPNKEINRMCEHLLGITTVNERDNTNGMQVTVTKRLSRPFFTEEYVNHLRYILFSYLNNVNAFTRFEDKSIDIMCNNISRAITDSLATDGDKDFISHDTWMRILAIHDSGDKQTGNVKTQKVSGWLLQGVDWNYNKPVTKEMVDYCKILDEESDQIIIFELVRGATVRLIKSVYNRSLQMPDNFGMSWSGLQGMRSESMNNNGQPLPMLMPQPGGGVMQ